MDKMNGRNSSSSSAPQASGVNGVSTSKHPTLADVVAVVHLLRVMFVIWGVMPLLTVVFPAFLWVWTRLLDFATSILALAFTLVFRGWIDRYAPTAEKRDHALYTVQYFLPLGSYFVFAILNRALSPVLEQIGLPEEPLRFTPHLPWTTALNLAGIEALLGVAIVIRYVGPISIVRCSTFPLISHPLSSQSKSLLARLTSVDQLLATIIAPGDRPDELITSRLGGRGRLSGLARKDGPQNGRRYQIPPVSVLMAQLSMCFGISFVSSFTVKPLLPDYTNASVIFVCIFFVTASHLYRDCLEGSSHELDFRLYRSIADHKVSPFADIWVFLKRMTASVVFIPIIASLASFYSEAAFSFEFWTMACWSFLVALGSFMYLALIDLLARYAFSSPLLKVRRSVREIAEDFSLDGTLDVIICSILHNDLGLIRAVRSRTNNQGTHHLEEEEVRRNELVTYEMAKILVQPTEEALDHDILRMTILEAFGGFPKVSRHEEAIECWTRTSTQPNERPWITGFLTSKSSGAVPIVRSLCCFCGGSGTALQKLSREIRDRKKKHDAQFKLPSYFDTWALPPGAIVSYIWAMNAITRFILASVKDRPDWRTSHLSMMVPVAIETAHTLRRGVIQFDHVFHMISNEAADMEYSPIVSGVVNACDNSAFEIISVLQVIDGGRTDLKVTRDCRNWLETHTLSKDQASTRTSTSAGTTKPKRQRPLGPVNVEDASDNEN